MTNIRETIARLPFFSDLNPEMLDIISELGKEVKIGKDQLIFKIGEPANHFYLLNRGEVRLEIYSPERGAIAIQTLKPGEILGWSWIFTPNTWHFDARTLEETTLIAFDAVTFLQLCEENSDLGYRMMKKFSLMMLERLQATRLQLLDVYGKR